MSIDIASQQEITVQEVESLYIRPSRGLPGGSVDIGITDARTDDFIDVRVKFIRGSCINFSMSRGSGTTRNEYFIRFGGGGIFPRGRVFTDDRGFRVLELK